MNRQIRHISVVALILLAALIVSTTYWQTWAKADLAARKDNSVTSIERLTVGQASACHMSELTFLLHSRHPRTSYRPCPADLMNS